MVEIVGNLKGTFTCFSTLNGSLVMQQVVMSQKALTLYEASEAEVTLKHFLPVTHVLTVS